MNQVPPLRLTPDGAQLLANRELLRLSKELSEVYAIKEKLACNPVRHFVDIMRRVMLKGSDLGDIAGPFGILGAEAVVMLALAVNRYRKTSE